MKNCIVKMVVKNRNRTNPQEPPHPDPTEEIFSTQTVNASRASEERESLGTQLKSLLGNFEKLLKEVGKPAKTYQLEPRDRKIVLELPAVVEGEKLKKQVLELWITNLCNEVFSAAFHYFERGGMNYDQTKIYCAENIISNIVRLNDCYQLDAAQMKTIDQHIEEGVSTYLLSKYPMTEIVVVNKALEAEVKETDKLEALENDLFFYSKDSYGFQYRESGNYNDLIMRFVNSLMSVIDSPDKESPKNKYPRPPTYYESFYELMQTTFERIQSRENMEGNSSTNFNSANIDNLTKKVEEEKYRARVKGYTSWVIGRKVSENVSQYSQSEIDSLHITIKSPAILRILTKWCQELWGKFDKKNYFLDRTENVKCQRGSNVNTFFAWMKNRINEMIEEEKVQIERFLETVFTNNYDQQAIHCFRSLRGNSFSHVEKFEKAAGVFTVNIVNNLHSYIILYLNRLLHGLLKVSKRLYDRELSTAARWTSPPNLISFKIGDLMRCKIGSQEREILHIFRHLSQMSSDPKQDLKIIRIKNRLKEGTNDILINVRFREKFICQVQLAVNSDHSNFIKCSNKYNHFIYEVKRSIFGPITELCSIWRSLDGRCKVYEKMTLSKAQKEKSGDDIQLRSAPVGGKGGCEKGGSHSWQRYYQPFVCTSCKDTYSHSNYIWPHHLCEICNITRCCKCRIAAEQPEILKEKLFKNSDLKGLAIQIARQDDIPKFGVCYLIESKHLQMMKFARLTIKGKEGLYYRKTKENIDLITELNFKKDIDSFKEKYIVFRLPVIEGEKIVNITKLQAKNEYLLPKLMKTNYKKQKELISLIDEDINDDELELILGDKNTVQNLIRNLELPDNQITNIDLICNKFPKLNRLLLSRNKIIKLDSICKLTDLEHLNIRQNLIEEFPPEFFNKLPKLESLNLRSNLFSSIPQGIENLRELRKLELNELDLRQLPASLAKMRKIDYLDLSKNKLGKVPDQLRQLKELRHLYLSKNDIKEVPEWIGELLNLQEIELKKNKLTDLPDSLSQLTKLVELEVDDNKFERLDFKCPKSITTLILKNNRIKEISDNFFANCSELVKLDLTNNQISALPFGIAMSCGKMKYLGLNKNKLSSLPRALFGVFLPSLEILQLNGNQFQKFPSELNLCAGLIELHLANNHQFNDVIPINFFDNNYKIEKLDVSGTIIPRLHDIKLAGTLKRLNFSDNPNISCEGLEVLDGLQFIEELALANMKLSALPKALKMMHSLHILNASNNQIASLDSDFFTRLTHLRYIALQNNKLTATPPSLQACKRVKVVNFSYNQLTEFPLLYDLARLEKIMLSNNCIGGLDNERFLPATVTDLDLSYNLIEVIPSNFLKKAEGLVNLNFSNNRLKERPKEIWDCINLNILNFEGNQIDFTEDVVRETVVTFMPLKYNEEDDDVTVDKELLMSTFMG